MLLKTCHVSGMKILSNKRTLLAAYQVAGFRASARIEEYEHTPPAFVITLVRRQKKRYAAGAGRFIAAFTVDEIDACVISIAENAPYIQK